MEKDSSRIWERLLAADDVPLAARATDKDEDRPPIDHMTTPVLLERAAYLRKLARAGQGEASETLKSYPGHSTMLSVRLRSGIAEFHQHFADVFIVLEGRATLVSGGSVVDPRLVAPGEVRGSHVEGGFQQELRAGDIAHVPAATPHQMIVTTEKGFAAIVLKIQQPEQTDPAS